MAPRYCRDSTGRAVQVLCQPRRQHSTRAPRAGVRDPAGSPTPGCGYIGNAREPTGRRRAGCWERRGDVPGAGTSDTPRPRRACLQVWQGRATCRQAAQPYHNSARLIHAGNPLRFVQSQARRRRVRAPLHQMCPLRHTQFSEGREPHTSAPPSVGYEDTLT